MERVDGNGSPELVYGLHAVREALSARGRPFLRILMAEGREDRRVGEILRLARSARIPVQVQPRAALDRLVPDGRHQGVIGLVASKAYVEPEAILARARERGEPPFVLILDQVQDPHNLGAVLRTAEAAGVHGVILPERRSAGLTAAVMKASAGAGEHLLVARVTNLSRTIESLQRGGLWVYAVHPEGSRSYSTVDLRGAVALVLGGEGPGVRTGVLEKCDERLAIPMRGRVASLNVSAAAAIVLYEVVRQRRGAGS